MDDMAEFIKVAKVTDIPNPGKQMLEVDDRLVVLFHVGDVFYCVDDVCTHDGGPLGDGELVDGTIACPRHGAQFDIKTGEALCMPATENTIVHQVKVDGDDVLVQINDE
jgi:3-phenylpropionate/trans-cinnamate dioxygenase ferredoxin subunit